MSESFIWTLTSVDVASGWTELRAIWNRGQHASHQGLESIYESQPFKLLGVDSDNGGEFLNYFVYDWLKKIGIHQNAPGHTSKMTRPTLSKRTTLPLDACLDTTG